ncbi:porin family protein [Pedobacter xixiisoli]|uniref:Outer membrane protein beta-barrel domain-containing protein n=1 Tax=Pedobacter xixiisoli TaxID=1476464 RepID=A0A286A0R0_9SPHI|nr:porin family protein [Pedobacter xixiisoli]SOD15490.1 Outer membrane protein beta-barrel domain-containing protein [Pedobacter xixiisoli]
MKKILLFGTALALSSSALFAQNTMSGSDARIGIKAGVNLSTIRARGFDGASAINDATKQNVGYNFTVFGDFGVGNNFFIQPGVSLQNKGTKLQNTTAGVTTEATANIMAVEVPVNAVFRIPTGNEGAIQISAGPYIGFNIDGKAKTKISGGANSGTTETDLKFGNDSGDNFTSTDFGANFGVGYRMGNGFLLGANYGMGLTNVQPKAERSGDSKLANRVWGFSLGYSF